MKTKLFLLLTTICLLLSTHLSAQLANGSIAPDFTTTDIYGETHNLYDYLDQGYTVILKFTATWCGPCWNYHNTGALENTWDNWGPGATDQVIVLFIESDANTNVACLYGPTGCNGTTQGNWVAGTNFPIINDHTIRPSYNVTYYPTIYGVCPTRKITLLGQAQPPAMGSFINDCGIVSFEEEINAVSCKDGSDGSVEIDFDTGIPPFSTMWSNGMSGELIDNIPAGNYSLTVTDGFGDDYVFTDIIVDEPSDYVNGSIIDLQPDNCFGGNGLISVQASGGNGNYSYSWSNGATSASISNLYEGIYSISITDQKNCMGSLENINIEKIPEPVAVAIGDDLVNCYIPEITLDGTLSSTGAQYSYLWTTQGGNIQYGETSLTPVVDGGGSYLLAVTDTDFNCTAYSTHLVTIDTLSAVVDAGDDFYMDCDQSSVTLDGYGDSGPGFTFNWTTLDGEILSGGTTLTPEIGSPGTYVLSIFYEFNGCENSDEVTVLSVPGQDLSLDQTNILCNGSETGAATVNISGGVEPYTINWSNGDNSSTINNLAAGTYTVTVSDAANCTSTAVAIISQPALLTADVTSSDVSEPGLNDGSIQVTPLGGSGGYSISWNHGPYDTFTLSDLGPGTYNYIITDSNGCTKEGFVAINSSGCSITVATELLVDVSCFGSDNGEASIITYDGIGDLNVSWSDGGSGTYRNDLTAGVYEVTVTDDNGCPGYLEFAIDQPEAITYSDLSISEIPCGDGATGSIELTTNGGTGDLTFMWSNGANTEQLFNLEVGSYSLSVSDENNCEQVFSFSVGVIDDEPPVVMAHTGLTFELDSTGQVEINPAWIDAGSEDNCGITGFSLSQHIFNCDETGEHEVQFIVTDAGGNTAVSTITLIVEDKQAPSIVCPEPFELNACDQIVTYDDILASDNCAIASIELMEGYASDEVFPIGTTNVIYKATDIHGNTNECAFQVNLSSENITAGIIIQDVSCFEGNNGSARINILSGGSEPYQYEWSNGNSTSLSQELTAGIYSVSVTDPTGCATVLNFEVEQPDELLAEIVNVEPDRIDIKGSIDIQASGGVAPYSLELICDEDTYYFQGTTLATELDACMYDVFVIDDNGCVILFESVEVALVLDTRDVDLANSLNIFPNPAGNMIQIELPEHFNSTVQYRIIDMHGKIVLQNEALVNENNTLPVMVNTLPDGVYSLFISDNNTIYSGRFSVIK